MGNNTRKCRLYRLAVAVAVMMVVLVAGARDAYADDYSITKVNIDATVEADGTVDVTEERDFSFDGSFHGVYWELPEGTYEGRTIEPEVTGVGEYVNGAYVPFALSSSGDDGTYTTYDDGSTVQVKVYSAHYDEDAAFVLTYRDANLATRWADTSELYWKFVSDGWDVESQNVTCTVHLPVPSGEAVDAGNNVRAWGHGPLDASLDFDGDGVVYSVPGVGTSEYAEARIVFPQSWLSSAQASSENHLDTILSEEQQWADEANAQRVRARILVVALYAGGAALAVVSLVVALRAHRAYRQSHAPHFTDKYFRDVPSNDHPAVLGALLRDGAPSTQDFSASLMRLTDLGYANLDTVTLAKHGLFGKRGKEVYRLSRTGKPVVVTTIPGIPSTGSQEASDIDNATLKFAFGKVAKKASRTELEDGSVTTKDQLLMTDFEQVAHAKPQAYSDAFDDWKGAVFAACAKRGFFVDEAESHRGRVRALGAADLAASVAVVALSGIVGLGFSGGVLAVILALVAAGIACMVIASGFKEVSREAIELKAQLVALRNWLCDFTRLKEAWPRDVVLWNRLLVMAVVLGVADRVVDQLKVAAPELLEADAMAPVYGWYYGSSYGPSPLRVMNDSLDAAHSVSVAQLAKTSFSSSGGGDGGGFSSGGGGGFGGGGGGGAF